VEVAEVLGGNRDLSLFVAITAFTPPLNFRLALNCLIRLMKSGRCSMGKKSYHKFQKKIESFVSEILW
jgi:hypothetical protein